MSRRKHLPGICTCCRTRPHREGLKTCTICHARNARNLQERITLQAQKGLCRFVNCPNPKLDNSTFCEYHFCTRISCAQWGKGNKQLGEQLFSMLVGQNRRCYLSGRAIVLGKNACIEHVIPRSKGGSFSIENLRWADRDANHAKRALTVGELKELCREILQHAP